VLNSYALLNSNNDDAHPFEGAIPVFVLAVMLMILRPLIPTSAKLGALLSPLHGSCGELDDEFSESRVLSGLDGDQAARKRT
jgi:hypothetical protein